MSFDLYFIAYELKPPSAAIAQEIQLAEKRVPQPQFDKERRAVTEELKEIFPQYQYSSAENGDDAFGGVLYTEDGDLPDINFSPDHAFIEAGTHAEEQKVVIKIAQTFERHHFVIYDPENEKLWTAAELEAWLPGATAAEQRVVNEIKKGNVKFKETSDGIIEYEVKPKKPWWQLW
jgi:hypothetical protein